MITIKPPYIETTEKYSKMICDVQIDEKVHTIWFQVDKRYEQYLCTERADAYLIGMLNYAMRNKHDIICEVPVSEDLIYSIEKDLIPSLSKHSKRLYATKIFAEIAPTLRQGDAVGTGASFGIDSFSAIYNHIQSKYPEHNLTHLCINNVGAFNECYDQYGAEQVKEERYVIAETVANELGIKLIKTDSNFASEIHQNHLQTHTYSSTFAIYCLQKLWKIYYYGSSGEDYAEFSIENSERSSSALYELLSLQCFSTSGLRIYSEGGAKTRFEKTKEIVGYLPAQKHLHVCLAKPYNCGECSKCRRTLVTLDLLGVLDDFSKSFDIEKYKKNRRKSYRWLCRGHFWKDKMNEPVYREYLKKPGFVWFAAVEWLKNVFLSPVVLVRKAARLVRRHVCSKR